MLLAFVTYFIGYWFHNFIVIYTTVPFRYFTICLLAAWMPKQNNTTIQMYQKYKSFKPLTINLQIIDEHFQSQQSSKDTLCTFKMTTTQIDTSVQSKNLRLMFLPNSISRSSGNICSVYRSARQWCKIKHVKIPQK